MPDSAQLMLSRRKLHTARILFIFLSVFFSLQYAWERSRDTALERLVIDRATVTPAAWWIARLWPDQTVSAQGHSLIAAHSRLNILNGCEGLETLLLLIAAFFSYPFSWRQRIVGISSGAMLIYVLNQARIVLLWYANQHSPQLFGLLHGTILPLALVAISFIFFLMFLPAQRKPV